MCTERTEVIVESICHIKLKVLLLNILHREIVTLHKNPEDIHLVNLMNQPKYLVLPENDMKDLEESEQV